MKGNRKKERGVDYIDTGSLRLFTRLFESLEWIESHACSISKIGKLCWSGENEGLKGSRMWRGLMEAKGVNMDENILASKFTPSANNLN